MVDGGWIVNDSVWWMADGWSMKNGQWMDGS